MKSDELYHIFLYLGKYARLCLGISIDVLGIFVVEEAQQRESRIIHCSNALLNLKLMNFEAILASGLGVVSCFQ